MFDALEYERLKDHMIASQENYLQAVKVYHPDELKERKIQSLLNNLYIVSAKASLAYREYVHKYIRVISRNL